MKTRCLIVDDEPLAIRLIEKHASQIESLEVVATCNSALKAFEILNKEHIDLLFIDIKMPNMTGIEFLQNIKNAPKTIFTTAYRDYAVESYELEIVDYLLKPITFTRFFKAVEKYFREIESTKQAINKPLSKETPSYIVVKESNKNHKVILKDIVYIESIKDYIKIHLANKEITTKYKIGSIEKELTDTSFLRVHRSFIINTEKISAFSNHELEIGKHTIPIGASYKEKVKAFLKLM